MTVRNVWIAAEEKLPTVLSRERDVSLFAFGSPERPPAQPTVDRFHAFLFNDIAEPRPGLRAPGEADVARLLDACAAVASPCVVFQCWMGVSRSTAAALLFLVATKRWPAKNSVRRLRDALPSASPNAAMLAHGDRLLGLDGLLSDEIVQLGRGADYPGPKAACVWGAS